MKRTLSIVFALALVLSFSLVVTTPVAGATLYVPSGYATIQAAVNAASPGDTIMVAAGTYAENVAVAKANLTLQSASKWGAIIKPTTAGSNAIYITANGVTVDGFEIDGTTVCKNGILGWETSGLTIKNNKIHGAVHSWDGCGILLFSWGNSGTVYNNLIKDNVVYDTGRMGIMVMDYGGGKYTVTSGNTITGNTVYDVWKKAIAWGDGGGGIQINVGKNCAITNNEVYYVRDNQRGIYMFGSAAGNTITGNTLRDNPVGIQLWISGEQPTLYINWGVEIPTSPQVRYNNIYGNLNGAKSTNIQGTPKVMDALYNWWGLSSGPYHATTNPSGTGNNVSDNVNYNPWASPTATATGTGTATFVATGGPISGLTAVAEGTLPTTGKPNLAFPHGFFSFDITGLTPGQTVTVTITLPTGAAPTQYWKYHSPEGWIQIPMTIVGPPNVIRITLVDGGLGDDDGVANGTIVDQGAPGGYPVGWETHPINKVRVLLPWIALIAAIIAGVSLLVLRRRRAQS